MSFNVPIVFYKLNFWNISLEYTNAENLTKYNWMSFSQKSGVWESKWLPDSCLGKSQLKGIWDILQTS